VVREYSVSVRTEIIRRGQWADVMVMRRTSDGYDQIESFHFDGRYQVLVRTIDSATAEVYAKRGLNATITVTAKDGLGLRDGDQLHVGERVLKVVGRRQADNHLYRGYVRYDCEELV
jgi:hypothetical protein